MITFMNQFRQLYEGSYEEWIILRRIKSVYLEAAISMTRVKDSHYGF